jgi:PAS domain-containing protein
LEAKESATGTLLLLGHVIANLVMIAGYVVFNVLLLTYTSSVDVSLHWIMWSARRRGLSLQVLCQCYMSLLVPDSYPSASEGWGMLRAELLLGNAKARFEEFDKLSSDLYTGSDELEALKDQFAEVDDLQIRDSCEPIEGGKRHDLYRCFSLQALTGLMSTLVKGLQLAVSPADPTQFSPRTHLNSANVIDLGHMVLTELATKLNKTSQVLREDLDSRNSLMFAILIVVIIVVALAFLFHFWLLTLSIHRSRRLAKAGMVLLRRVPPPALVDSNEITRIILGQNEFVDQTADSTSVVAFEHVPRASLIVSIDETIGDINGRGREMFGLERRQVIGQKLTTLIRKPEENGDELNDLELGSEALFESLATMRKPGCENYHWTGNVNCARVDDSIFACRANVEGVPDLSGSLCGFLVFLAESAEEQQITKQLKEAKEHVTRLQNQLVPSDVQGFIRDGRTDFAFHTKIVSVVAVQIGTFAAHLKQAGGPPFLERVRRLWGRLGVFCAQHPPLLRQAELTDSFIAVAGLFSADDPRTYANASLDFAKDVLEEVQTNEPELKVLIGITVGGPLLCGLTGSIEQTFVASGEAIEEAVSLAELSGPNKVLVSAATKDLLPDVEFEPGGDATRGYCVRIAPPEGHQKRPGEFIFNSQLSLPPMEEAPRMELSDIQESGE